MFRTKSYLGPPARWPSLHDLACHLPIGAQAELIVVFIVGDRDDLMCERIAPFQNIRLRQNGQHPFLRGWVKLSQVASEFLRIVA